MKHFVMPTLKDFRLLTPKDIGQLTSFVPPDEQSIKATEAMHALKIREAPTMDKTSPTHYTEMEGGYWLEWKFGAIDVDSLVPYLNCRRICINEQSVHSLSWCVQYGDEIARWDCINGWTKQPKEWGSEQASYAKAIAQEAPAIGVDMAGEDEEQTHYQIVPSMSYTTAKRLLHSGGMWFHSEKQMKLAENAIAFQHGLIEGLRTQLEASKSELADCYGALALQREMICKAVDQEVETDDRAKSLLLLPDLLDHKLGGDKAR